MFDSNNKKFTDREIIDLLAQVNDKLKEQNKTASILISGGAAMALLFNRERVTQDVDAVFLGNNSREFRSIVSQVGDENGLRDDWLNDAVKGFIDLDWKRELIPAGFSNLIVYSVPADKLLAMKLSAGRSDTRDREDAIDLMKYLDIKSADEALNVLEEALPESTLTARMKYYTIDTFEEYKTVSKRMENPRICFTISDQYVKKGIESSRGDGQTYNSVTLPKGTVVDGRDLSGGIIYPLDFNLKTDELDGSTAVEYKPDQEVQVNFRNGQKVKVKAEELCEGVEAANEKYLTQQKEITRSKEKDHDMEL